MLAWAPWKVGILAESKRSCLICNKLENGQRQGWAFLGLNRSHHHGQKNLRVEGSSWARSQWQPGRSTLSFPFFGLTMEDETDKINWQNQTWLDRTEKPSVKPAPLKSNIKPRFRTCMLHICSICGWKPCKRINGPGTSRLEATAINPFFNPFWWKTKI